MAIDYFLGLATADDVSSILQRARHYLGGKITGDELLLDFPGLLIYGRRLSSSRIPEPYTEEAIQARVSLTFTLHGGETVEEKQHARWSMFVTAANLSVDLDCDALMTFQLDVAALRRRKHRLELFDRWPDWREPWVAERLPTGYLLSDEVVRY